MIRTEKISHILFKYVLNINGDNNPRIVLCNLLINMESAAGTIFAYNATFIVNSI